VQKISQHKYSCVLATQRNNLRNKPLINFISLFLSPRGTQILEVVAENQVWASVPKKRTADRFVNRDGHDFRVVLFKSNRAGTPLIALLLEPPVVVSQEILRFQYFFDVSQMSGRLPLGLAGNHNEVVLPAYNRPDRKRFCADAGLAAFAKTRDNAQLNLFILGQGKHFPLKVSHFNAIGYWKIDHIKESVAPLAELFSKGSVFSDKVNQKREPVNFYLHVFCTVQ
jgi:hypothetical protein